MAPCRVGVEAMRDKRLIELFATQEVFVDGFTDHKIRNGNMSCVGFRYEEPAQEGDEPLKVVVIRLIFPKDGIAAAIEEAQAAMSVVTEIVPTLWLRKAH